MDRHTAEDERFLKEVERLLGWPLDPERRAEALRCREGGESAGDVAERIEGLETARQALNDPDAPLRPPPTRPADDDPRAFPKTARRPH